MSEDINKSQKSRKEKNSILRDALIQAGAFAHKNEIVADVKSRLLALNKQVRLNTRTGIIEINDLKNQKKWQTIRDEQYPDLYLEASQLDGFSEINQWDVKNTQYPD